MRRLVPLVVVVGLSLSPRTGSAQTAYREDPRDLAEEDSDLDPTDRALVRSGERLFGVPVELSVSGQMETFGERQSRGIMLLLRLPLSRGPLTRVSQVQVPSSPAPTRRARLPARLVRETVKAALRTNGLGPERDRLDGLAVRARASAVLPELRLRVVRGVDQSLRLLPTDADPYRTQATDGASMLYEARATWRLDRLVFADEEIAVERLRAERATERRKLVHHVLEVLATYQRARPTTNGTVEEQEEREARRAAASAMLDGLTDGVWSSLLSAMEPDEVLR